MEIIYIKNNICLFTNDYLRYVCKPIFRLMRRFFLLLVLMAAQKGNSQTPIAQFIRAVFLNAPIEKDIFNWIDYYKHTSLLTYKQVDNKWTGENEAGNVFQYHTDGFVFTSHPELSFPFNEGEIDITVSSMDSVRDASNATLVLNFKDTTSAERAYTSVSSMIKTFAGNVRPLYDEDIKINTLTFSFPGLQTKYFAFLSIGRYENGHTETPFYVRLMIFKLPSV